MLYRFVCLQTAFSPLILAPAVSIACLWPSPVATRLVSIGRGRSVSLGVSELPPVLVICRSPANPSTPLPRLSAPYVAYPCALRRGWEAIASSAPESWGAGFRHPFRWHPHYLVGAPLASVLERCLTSWAPSGSVPLACPSAGVRVRTRRTSRRPHRLEPFPRGRIQHRKEEVGVGRWSATTMMFLFSHTAVSSHQQFSVLRAVLSSGPVANPGTDKIARALEHRPPHVSVRMPASARRA